MKTFWVFLPCKIFCALAVKLCELCAMSRAASRWRSMMSQPWSLVSQSSAPSGVIDGRSIKVRRGSRRGTQTTGGEEAAGGGGGQFYISYLSNLQNQMSEILKLII